MVPLKEFKLNIYIEYYSPSPPPQAHILTNTQKNKKKNPVLFHYIQGRDLNILERIKQDNYTVKHRSYLTQWSQI